MRLSDFSNNYREKDFSNCTQNNLDYLSKQSNMKNKTSQCLEIRRYVALEIRVEYGFKITENFHQIDHHR